MVHRPSVPLAEIERLARAICGEVDDQALFAAAQQIAENEYALQAIQAQQTAVIERLRQPDEVPLAKKDNSLQLATARAMQAFLADREFVSRLPEILEKYADSMPEDAEWLIGFDTVLPLRLKALLGESEPAEEGQDDTEPTTPPTEERDQFEALEAALPDLLRLDRYHKRIWSRQKRAVCAFINLKLMRRLGGPASGGYDKIVGADTGS